MHNQLVREHFTAKGTPKRGYNSREEALMEVADKPVDAYECTLCNKWHRYTLHGKRRRRKMYQINKRSRGAEG